MEKGPVAKAIDSLNDDALEGALRDFIVEHKLVGEFLVWLEKWKSNKGIQ